MSAELPRETLPVYSKGRLLHATSPTVPRPAALVCGFVLNLFTCSSSLHHYQCHTFCAPQDVYVYLILVPGHVDYLVTVCLPVPPRWTVIAALGHVEFKTKPSVVVTCARCFPIYVQTETQMSRTLMEL